MMTLHDKGAAGAPRYDSVAIFLHWAVAALVVILGGLGLTFEAFARPTRAALINLHVTVGLVFLALVALRVLWRATHRPPPYPAEWPAVSITFARLGHVALYALLVAAPIVGLAARVWHGRDFNFGLFRLDFGVASQRAIYNPAEEIHEVLAYALMALAALHVVAALWRRLALRDGTLARIWPLR